MTDTDAQRLLRELQAEAVSVFEYDAAVSGILADELPYYFAEEQSAGQIADRIQRVFSCTLKKPVAESRGFRCCAETRRMI